MGSPRDILINGKDFGNGRVLNLPGSFEAKADGTIEVTIAAGAPGEGVSDHGALTGLGDDDHAQYALADGSRGTFPADAITVDATELDYVAGADLQEALTELDGALTSAIEDHETGADPHHVYAKVVNLDSDPGRTLYVSLNPSADPSGSHTLAQGDVLLKPKAGA